MGAAPKVQVLPRHGDCTKGSGPMAWGLHQWFRSYGMGTAPKVQVLWHGDCTKGSGSMTWGLHQRFRFYHDMGTAPKVQVLPRHGGCTKGSGLIAQRESWMIFLVVV